MKRSKSNRARRTRLETLERRNLLAADVGHNFIMPYDTNLSGDITALDALNGINEIERRNNGNSGSGRSFLSDVDGNGEVTAGDIIRIINRIGDPLPDASELTAGIDRLAQSILSEDLPGRLSPQEADRWLARMEDVERDIAPERKGPFNRLDENGDGEITEDEVREGLWSKLSNADADQSGSVTKEELKAARPSEQDVERPKPEAESAFDRLDANEDGALSADEVSEKRWNRLSKADADEDGSVTKEEIQDEREEAEDEVQRPEPGNRFAQLDLNEDGQLTDDEVRERVWDNISAADADENGAVTLDEIRTAREEHEERVQRPKPADVFAKLDVNEDGALTSDEVGDRVWAKLSKADANEDGAVTVAELKALRDEREDGVQRPSPRERFESLDVNEDGALTEDEVSEEIWAKLVEADANTDGSVTLDELNQLRAEMEDGVQRPEPGKHFDSLDLNNDGKLTQDEVSDIVWQRIAQSDLNQDGQVTLDEINQSRVEREGNLDEPADRLSREMFDRLDTNQDGSLTIREVTAAAWTKIEAADANNDGKVSFQELQDHKGDKPGQSLPETIFEGDYDAWADLQPVVGPNGPFVYVRMDGIRPESASFVTADNTTIAAMVRPDGVIVGNGAVFAELTEIRVPRQSGSYTGVDVLVEVIVEGERQLVRLSEPKIDRVD